jgi:hypothetical protein
LCLGIAIVDHATVLGLHTFYSRMQHFCDNAYCAFGVFVQAIQQAEWLEAAQDYLTNDEQIEPRFELQALQKLTADGTKLGSHPSCKSALTTLRQMLIACETHEQKALQCMLNR